MAKIAKQEATIRPIHVCGTTSPYLQINKFFYLSYPIVVIVILILIIKRLNKKLTTPHQRASA